MRDRVLFPISHAQSERNASGCSRYNLFPGHKVTFAHRPPAGKDLFDLLRPPPATVADLVWPQTVVVTVQVPAAGLAPEFWCRFVPGTSRRWCRWAW
jgi:hypothetical protein